MSKVTIKPPKRRQWRCFGGLFIVNFEHMSHFCFTVSMVNFEQVNASWENTQKGNVTKIMMQNNVSCHKVSGVSIFHNMVSSPDFKCAYTSPPKTLKIQYYLMQHKILHAKPNSATKNMGKLR